MGNLVTFARSSPNESADSRAHSIENEIHMRACVHNRWWYVDAQSWFP